MSPRFGLTWPGAELGREAEAAGSAAFVTGEFADHDAYVAAGEMASHTHTARVGTGIAYAFARTPYAHAAALRHLHGSAPDRLFAGFGSGAYRINQDWFGVPADRPVARMSELLRAVRVFLRAENGERIRFDGQYYHVDAAVRAPVMGALDIPILLGAFNSRMLRTAGEVADGIIGHGLFTTRWWREIVRPQCAAGRARSELASAPIEYGWLLIAIDDEDPERARRDVRRMIAFYLTVRGYDRFADFHGWTAAVETIRTAFAAGDTDAMADAVTDEMLSEIGFAGTTSDVVKALAHRGEEGLPADIGFVCPPSFLVSRSRRVAYSRAALSLL